jgi:uncharacterized protein with beta-barrel porin domain
MLKMKTQIVRNRLALTASVFALAAACTASADAQTISLPSGFNTVTLSANSGNTGTVVAVNGGTASSYDTLRIGSGITGWIVPSWGAATWAVQQNTALVLNPSNISGLTRCQNSGLAYSSTSCLNHGPTIQVDQGGTLHIGGVQTNSSMQNSYGFESVLHIDGNLIIDDEGSPSWNGGNHISDTFVGSNYFGGNITVQPNARPTFGLSWAAAPTQFGTNTNVILGAGSIMSVYQAAGTPLVMGGSLQGTGRLTLGAGTLVINGQNTAATPFLGTLAINPGNTLIIGDSTHQTAVFGDPGHPTAQTLTISGTAAGSATLMGYGTIAANVVNNAGKVIPGGTVGVPGALTVQSYTQNATGTLKFQVSPAGVSSLHVLGNASVDGSLILSISAGAYGMQTFDLLKVDGTLTGNFSNVSVESTAGNAIAAGVLTSSSGYRVITEVVQGANTTRPIVAGHLVSVNRLNNTYFVNSLYDQIAMDSPRGSQQIGRNKYVWAEGFGRVSSVSRNDVGYHTSTGGFTAGAEYRTEANYVVGLAASYSNTSLKAKGTSTADMDTWHIAAYGGADVQYFRLDGAVFYNGFSADTKRDFDTSGIAKTSPGGYAYGGSVQVSLPIFRGLVTPYLRGIISRQHLDRTVETGVDLLNLRYNAINGNYFVGDVGFRIDPLRSHPESKTKLLVTVALEHDFSTLGEKVTGTFPVESGLPWTSYWRGDSENTGIVGVDVAQQITDKLEIAGRLNGRFSLFQTSGELALNAKYKF